MLLLERVLKAANQAESVDVFSQTQNECLDSDLAAMRSIKTALAQGIRRPSAPYRGLMGLAFALDQSKAFDVNGHALLPNAAMRIWAMLDAGIRQQRQVLLSELDVALQHGKVISLLPSGPTYDIMLDPGGAAAGQRETCPLPGTDWNLWRLAAKMDWTMASTAALAHRQGWEKVGPELFAQKWAGAAARRAVNVRRSPEFWSPVPYTRSALGALNGTQGYRIFPLPLRTRFMDEMRVRPALRAPSTGLVWMRDEYPWLVLAQGSWTTRVFAGRETEVYVENGQEVLAGTPLACEWPEFSGNWHRQPMRWRWQGMVEYFGSKFPKFFMNWWERQRLEGWLPLPLAGCGNVSDKEVAWDFAPGITPYFDDGMACYIVPPVFPGDLRFHGELAHGVSYDLRGLLV